MAPLLANFHRYGTGQGLADYAPRSFGSSDAVGSGVSKQHRRAPRLAFLLAIVAGVLVVSASPAFASRTYEGQITEANENNFSLPESVAVDDSDNLWVLDTYFTTASKFDPTSHFLVQNTGTGSWAGSQYLADIAYGNTANNLYVADSNLGDVWGINADASFAGIDLNNGLGGGCCFIRGVAVDNSGGANDGDIYVGLGSAITRIDAGNAASNFSATAPYIDGNQLTGTPGGPFSITDVAVDQIGNIYVADSSAKAIDKFNASGVFLQAFTNNVGNPSSIAIDPTNNDILIGDYEHGAVHELDSSGAFVDDISAADVPSGSLRPQGIAVDSTGTLYVTNLEDKVVDIFSTGGPKQPLTVSVTGSGSVGATRGAVTGCTAGGGSACEGEYGEGSMVSLTANPAAHNHLAGWSAIEGDPGTCTGTTSPCQVAMSEAKKLKAEFAVNTHTVDVDVSGAGSVSASSGTVSGCTEAGGASCSGTYAEDSTLTLTANPAAHHKLAWTVSGAKSTTCTGTTSPCTVVIGAANVSVSATSVAITHALTVTKAGSGSGSVSCNGGPCAASYEEGMSVTIAATAAAGSTFAGFSGAGCSGTASCVVTINADTALSATFNANPPLVIPPVVIPPANSAAYGQCVSKAGKAFKKAKKSANAKHGKAKSKALKKATKAKSGAVAKCKAQFK